MMMQLGAQCYTLRSTMQTTADIARSLERVARIGYRFVQISGIGPIKPETLQHICQDNGIQIVLTHNSEDRILHDTDALIREHETYGCRYIGIGSMPDRYRSVEWVDYFAEDFLPAAQRMKSAGMRLMYHNHNFEFERLSDGRTIMDAILGGIPDTLMGVTADTYWLQAAGINVCAWLRKNASRLQCVHLKDMTVNGYEIRMAPVTHGNIDFPAIIDTLRDLNTTEYALVEQDNCYESPFVCLDKSYRGLIKLGLK